MKGWLLKTPNGTLAVSTFTEVSASDCILKAVKGFQKIDKKATWGELYRVGCKCVLVEIRELNEEPKP